MAPMAADLPARIAKEGGESAMKRILAVGLMVVATVVPFAPQMLGLRWG